MHTLPLFYPTSCMPSPYSILPHGCPPLFYPPIPCMPSPYSIPAHAWNLINLINFIPPYACPPLFYPSPCMPSPVHAHPLLIIFHPMHALSLFYGMHSSCSLPAHAYPPNSLSHSPWKHFSFDILCHFWICLHWVYYHHLHLSNLKHQFMIPGTECLLFSFTWTHPMNNTLEPLLSHNYLLLCLPLFICGYHTFIYIVTYMQQQTSYTHNSFLYKMFRIFNW